MSTSFENLSCEKKSYYEYNAALGRPSLPPRELFQLREWKETGLNSQNSGTYNRTSTPFYFSMDS